MHAPLFALLLTAVQVNNSLRQATLQCKNVCKKTLAKHQRLSPNVI